MNGVPIGRIVFRRARPDDAEMLARARHDVWNATYRGIYPDEWIDGYDYAAQTARWRAQMRDTSQEIWLVTDGGTCAGYFGFGAPNYGAYKDFSFCLNALYLLPPYQRMGLGRRIFEQLRCAALAHGTDRFFCGCNIHNVSARHFYEKMGGVAGKIDSGHENRAEDQMYFEFYLGEAK